MPPVVNPVSDLARIYRQRVPTQTSQARFGPEAVARIQPNMNRGAGPLGVVGRLARTAVESLDPRLILSEGGRSVQHAVGDATELAKSVISGRDTLSQSPTARTYQAAGGGAQGAFAAAMPYVNLASTAAPFVAPARAAMLERAAARQTADATEQLAQQIVREQTPARLSPVSEPASTIVIKTIQDTDGAVRLGAYNTKTEQIVGSMQLNPTDDGGPMVVTGLVSDNPIAMLKMLAAAKAKAQSFAPEMKFPLYPDESLSVYSRPLVERLQRANLVDPNIELPDPMDLNEITRDDWMPFRFASEIYLGKGETVQPSEYSSIYEDVRRALRQSREPGERVTLSSKQLTGQKLSNRLAELPSSVGVDIDRNMRQAGMTLDEFVDLVANENFQTIASRAIESDQIDQLLSLASDLNGFNVIGDMEQERILQAIISQSGL